MKNLHQLRMAAALATALALSCMNGPAGAEESATVPTDPGFKADTGQINPGMEEQAPSQSSEVTNIPTPEESRRALMEPISKQPSLGETPSAPRPEVQTFGGPNSQRESQNAAGGPEGLTTAGTAPDSNASRSDRQAVSATSQRSSASSEPPPSGPIGSVGETIPAKFSKRNDILDRTPIMAFPLPLSDQQLKQIYDAVMAENTQPVAGADALKPASELSTNQALNGMHPLPESVRGIDGVAKLHYVKAKNKVLLVEASTRTVVEQITF
jgi:hypothetical protein